MLWAAARLHQRCTAELPQAAVERAVSQDVSKLLWACAELELEGLAVAAFVDRCTAWLESRFAVWPAFDHTNYLYNIGERKIGLFFCKNCHRCLHESNMCHGPSWTITAHAQY